MTRKRAGLEKLDSNLLVPFVGSMAEKIKRISAANGLPNTIVIRMVMDIGMKEIENGKELKLVMPGEGESAGV